MHVPVARLSPENSEKVLAELERVLASPLFRGSRRCHNLLRRITEESLAGDVDRLKERSLGVDVFGRPADYDTGEDPVVRASAAEIRKKLAQYYQEAGHDSHVHIELPSGSYLAEFHFVQPRPPEKPPEAPPKSTSKRRWIAALITIPAAIVISGLLLAPRWETTDLDRLWAPVRKAPGTVLVSVGLQAAYNWRSAQAQDEVQGILPPQGRAAARRPIRENDLVLLKDRYVALDDALCLVRITSLLGTYKKPFQIRAERSISFADLRDTPAVLIGAFDNSWTLRTGGQLRFTFRKDSEHDTGMVVDSQHPENTRWKLSNYWPNWDITVDYAIVTRMVDANSDRPVILAAGLTQYGTIGAGEFLTDPEHFSQAVRNLPKNWQKLNLQFVLSVPVVNHVAGHPRVLETHYW